MADPSQSQILRNAMARPPVRVIAVTSGKGGVGKTNVAANVAVAMSALGRNVMILDADLGLANVDVLLGLQPKFNLAHVLNGEADLASTILSGPKSVRVVPSASGSPLMMDLPPSAQATIVNAFSELDDQPDVLIVDTATGISDSVARFVDAANQAIVVVCDEPASLTDAYALIKVLSLHYGISHFDVVTNQSRREHEGRFLFEKLRRVADRFLDVVLRHLGDIPHDDWLRRAVQEQRSVVDAYPASEAGRAFLAIASALDASAAPRGVGGSVQFFLERSLGLDAGSVAGTA
jgi:flagellar biosynthesis protein FlhG